MSAAMSGTSARRPKVLAIEVADLRGLGREVWIPPSFELAGASGSRAKRELGSYVRGTFCDPNTVCIGP
jgi:hypothetical protein